MHTVAESLGKALAADALRHRQLLVAVSGGADSVALLRGLERFRDQLSLELTAAHLDHRLRGEESTADAGFVVDLCGRLGIAVEIGAVDVAERAGQWRVGIEEAARRCRYEFLGEVALQRSLAAVAVGHTADDRVETVLHHILRGTGLSGLAGMPAARPLAGGVQLIRPLLQCTRAEIEDYLGSIGQGYRCDATNEQTEHTRNRLRRELLPRLRREFNPQVDRALLNLADTAADVQAAVEFAAGQLLDAATIECTPASCRLSVAALRGLPEHLVRECFARLWIAQNWPRKRMNAEHYRRLASIVQTGGAATLPGGIEVRCRRDEIVCERNLLAPQDATGAD